MYLQANTAKCIKAGGLWFKDKAIGINTLAKTMKTMAKEAKIESLLTNHSLHASCTTLLHNDEYNLPEQVIAECTGHRSLAIRGYKHTKVALNRKVSDILTSFCAGVESSDLIQEDGECESDTVKKAKRCPSVVQSMLDGTVKLDVTVSVKK